MTGPVKWAIACIMVWTVSWMLSSPGIRVPEGVLDHLWYLTAVLILCPFIAVLGARNPGAVVWGWFIILPLCLVLEISAIRQWGNNLVPEAFMLDTPTIVGFLVVMVMGLGNYFGTKLTTSIFVLDVILFLLVAPYSEMAPEFLPEKQTSRILATFLFLVLLYFLNRSSDSSRKDLFPIQRIWFDFLDSYGVVWGKRFIDQMNQTAKEQDWNIHLELEGFVKNTDSEPVVSLSNEELEKVTRAFHRHLKRFVEPSWIDERL